MSQRIVIVGGGYLGVQLAKGLDSKAEVTLIEPRSHFAHTPALIRAVVVPELLDQALIPYDGLLKNGRVIKARATSIDANGVTLENGQEVPADYIVVATGSSNAVPFKPKSDSIEAFRADNARGHNMLKAAKSVAIVGAGAVGTELAGEIAHFMPEKDVTLVSAEPSLFPQMPQKLGAELTSKLSKAGVKTVFGAQVKNLESTTEPYSGTLELSNGQRISADLIFPVIGSRAATDILETLPGASKGNSRRIETDAWLRPSELPNVFAAGDVAETGDAMTVVGASRQAPWLEKTLVSLMDGKAVEDTPPYKPWDKAPFLVPLGPQKGNSYLVLFTAGSFLTRALKGKDLFLSKYNKMLGRG
ncbi:NAD(P)/FAD-dependent oxidoreductase [Neptunicoccus cionae]|uniref:NAD(P)/FAD-dependent oxidoreductase n=1 Tax=Neptunicoccus cionae TaxID=2035344 RepID=UPI000C78F41D|nr:FAD-dependent oxidoreductase [Amylibacter cionae]PLS23399.1 N-acyl homoserine lactone synthase [Amylibacter cionae]